MNLRGDQAGQARLARPRPDRLAHGALRRGDLEGDPAAVEDTGADGIELNFGCPHGMSERGMGSAVGQVPEYIEMVARWCKAYTRMPVIVKLTPNITDIRKPAEAAQGGGADAVSLINTINSIMGVDLDTMTPRAGDRRQGHPRRLLRPGGEADRAATWWPRSPATRRRGLPISGIGGIDTWRDAAEFMALGAGTVQVCTAAMVYGFKIVEEMITGLGNWMDEKGYASVDQIVGRAVPNVTDWQYLNLNYVVKARIDQDLCIKCGRCHIACEDTSHQAITHRGRQAPFRGDRRRVRRLQDWMEAAAAFEADEDPERALTMYITAKMHFSRQRPYGSRVWASEIMRGAPVMERFLGTTLKAWVNARVRTIRSWISAGKIRPVDPESLLYMIWAVTQHYADFERQIAILNGGDEFDEREYREKVEQVVGADPGQRGTGGEGSRPDAGDSERMKSDDDALIEAAKAVRARAHAPYSHYHVGSAVLDEKGRIHSGCNVENAAYPEGICAETSAIAAMVAAGGTRIVAIAAVGGRQDLEACTPAAAADKRILEFSDRNTRIILLDDKGQPLRCTMDELLPASFRLR